MRKLSTLSLAFILTLPWLAGCNHTDQGPSAEKTVTQAGGGMGKGYNPNGSDQPFVRPGPPENINSVTLPVRNADLPSNINWANPSADMILVSVHFEFDQFNIDTEDRPLLEAAAKKMAADPTMRVVAVGHCDHYGSEQYNLALSDRRANSVKGYLTRNGAGADQAEILALGKFSAVPDVKKNSPEAKNDRRVDVVIIPAGVTVPSGPPPTDTTAVTPTAAP